MWFTVRTLSSQRRYGMWSSNNELRKETNGIEKYNGIEINNETTFCLSWGLHNKKGLHWLSDIKSKLEMKMEQSS
jgi:hypothetical protein